MKLISTHHDLAEEKPEVYLHLLRMVFYGSRMLGEFTKIFHMAAVPIDEDEE